MKSDVCHQCEYYNCGLCMDVHPEGVPIDSVWNCGIADDIMEEKEYRKHLEFIKDELEERTKNKEWDE